MSTPRWPDERVMRLYVLWDEGHTASEIGRKLGVSKNSVVGKAHRLDLPARPSPIKGGPNYDPHFNKRQAPRGLGKKSTLPSLAAPVAPESPKVVFLPRRSVECSYPIGEPGTSKFRYCDDPTVPGKSYCLEHCKLCFVPKKRAA